MSPIPVLRAPAAPSPRLRRSRPLPYLAAAACLLLACGAPPDLRVGAEPGPTTPTPAAPGSDVAAAHGAAVPSAGADASALPPGHPAIGSMPESPAAGAAGAAQPMPVVPAGSGVGASALAWTAPGSWVVETPSNVMRKAQYRVPGPGGDGECVVFYLGPGQGGDARTNAERWAGQFVRPDGEAVRGETATRALTAGREALLVEATGPYMSGGMMGAPTVPKPGWALLGAVVPGPDADWYFKLTGPEATVAAQKGAFESMIDSTRPGA